METLVCPNCEAELISIKIHTWKCACCCEKVLMCQLYSHNQSFVCWDCFRLLEIAEEYKSIELN